MTAATPNAFARALAHFLHTRDRLNSLPVETTTQADEDLFIDAFRLAERELLRTPATNIADLRTKAEILLSDINAPPPSSFLTLLFRDLHQLTGGTPSRVFDATAWLDRFERIGGMHCTQGDQVFLLVEPIPGDTLDDHMFEMHAHGGMEAVKQLIRERAAAREGS